MRLATVGRPRKQPGDRPATPNGLTIRMTAEYMAWLRSVAEAEGAAGPTEFVMDAAERWAVYRKHPAPPPRVGQPVKKKPRTEEGGEA